MELDIKQVMVLTPEEMGKMGNNDLIKVNNILSDAHDMVKGKINSLLDELDKIELLNETAMGVIISRESR
jgi:hypothetical protein